jgi:hypothetical protein
VRSRLSWRRRWRPRWTEEVRPSGTTRATDLRPLVCGTTPLPTRRWPTYRCPCRAGASNHQRRPGAGTDGAGSGRPLRCRRQGRRVAGATPSPALPLYSLVHRDHTRVSSVYQRHSTGRPSNTATNRPGSCCALPRRHHATQCAGVATLVRREEATHQVHTQRPSRVRRPALQQAMAPRGCRRRTLFLITRQLCSSTAGRPADCRPTGGTRSGSRIRRVIRRGTRG